MHERVTSVTILQRYEWLTAARVELETDHLQQGIDLLLSLRALCHEAGLFNDVIAAGVALAGAYSRIGKTERALAELREALTIAEPEGYIRMFVDGGEPIRELLTQIRGSAGRQAKQQVVDGTLRTVSAWYVEEIAATFVQDRTREIDAITGAGSSPDILTLRERDVLALLAEGLSYADITEQLTISENTLKSHQTPLQQA